MIATHATPSATGALPFVQANAAAGGGPVPETAFQDLLSGAMQSDPAPRTRQPQRNEEAGDEAQQPDNEQPVSPKKNARKTEQPGPEDAAAAMAQSLPENRSDVRQEQSEPEGLAVDLAPPLPAEQTVLVPQLLRQEVEVPVSGQRQATGEEQAALPVSAQLLAEPLPQPENAASAASGNLPETPIVQAELVVEDGPHKPVEARINFVEMPSSEDEADPAQTRFDEMIVRASRQLRPTQTVRQDGDKAEAEETMPVRLRNTVSALREPEKKGAGKPEESLVQLPTERPSPRPAAVQTVRFQPLERAMTATPAEQVQAQLLHSLEQQRMEFHMQLRPQELGRIDVRMVLEDGRLAVHIAAQTSRAAEALQRQTDGLMASMRLGGVQLDSVQVVQEPQAQEGYMNGAFNMMSQSGGSGGEQTPAGHSFAGAGRSVQDAGSEVPTVLPAEPERLLDAAV